MTLSDPQKNTYDRYGKDAFQSVGRVERGEREREREREERERERERERDSERERGDRGTGWRWWWRRRRRRRRRLISQIRLQSETVSADWIIFTFILFIRIMFNILIRFVFVLIWTLETKV